MFDSREAYQRLLKQRVMDDGLSKSWALYWISVQSMASEVPVPPTPTLGPDTPATRTNPWIWWIVGGVVLLIFGLVGAYLYSQNSVNLQTPRSDAALQMVS